MTEQQKRKIPARPELTEKTIDFISGFVFVKEMCGYIYYAFTTALKGYCKKEGINSKTFIKQMQDRYMANGGRPKVSPFSETTETEFIRYIAKSEKYFPNIRASQLTEDDIKAMEEENKPSGGIEPETEAETFISGFVFLRNICGAIEEDFAIEISEFCEERGINEEQFIEEIKREQEKNNGRPKTAPFSKSAEDEFDRYIAKSEELFPVLKRWFV